MQSTTPSLRGYPIDTTLRDSRAVVIPLHASVQRWLRRVTDTAWAPPEPARLQVPRQPPDHWGRVSPLGDWRDRRRIS